MGTVTGRVTTPSGAGQPAVWVYAVGQRGGVHTDRGGNWRLELPPGRWQVREVGHRTHDVLVEEGANGAEGERDTTTADAPEGGAPSRDAIAALLARRRSSSDGAA